MNSPNPIVIYETDDGQTAIEVQVRTETIWLSQAQMAILFDKDSDTIGMHLKNIFRSGELDETATTERSSVVQREGNRQVRRNTKVYNLDAIISVGYRVNSKKGTQFRIWATTILRQYLIQGYALNEQKLRSSQEKLHDLKQAIALSSRLIHNKNLSTGESQGILAILEKYSHALTVLDDYDHQRLKIEGTQKAEQAPIRYAEAMAQIHLWREQEQLGGLFGNEKNDSFKGSLATIYQTSAATSCIRASRKKQPICSISSLNHSFSDGNKRIAAAIFAWFLQRHDYRYNASGEKRIADNALVAFTLLIAESKPEEKDTIVKVIINLINSENG